MATTIERGTTPTPSGQQQQHSPTMSTKPSRPSVQTNMASNMAMGMAMEPPSPQQSAIHAPLPTRRMLSQLLRQWQQSFPQSNTSSTTNTMNQPTSSQQSQTSPLKETPSTASFSSSTTTTTTALPETPKQKSTEFAPLTPQPSRTPRLVSPATTTTTSTSTSPHLQITTPTHTRRASITTFLPTDALLMSPIPRARNPGGFRHQSEEEMMPFGEVVGLVGGWEEKMRSATAWAVVNTRIPTEKGSLGDGGEEAEREERKERRESQ